MKPQKKILHLSKEVRQSEQEHLKRHLSSRDIPRWRWMLWIFEAVVLLAVVEHFLVRPFFARRVERNIQRSRHGECIGKLGEQARLPAGLREAENSYYPLMDGLAEGSVRMLEAQKSVSGECGLPIEVENSVGMKFRLVPAGTCLIGSPEGESGRGTIEKRHVRIFPEHFYMGKYEVTQAQWKQVMCVEKTPATFKGDERPVEEITWYDCQRFVVKLNELEGLPEGTYRLPSEAEWEYACRAGTDTAFCFGDDCEKLADWADYQNNNFRKTKAVGMKLPNALGLYDMHGNVWEWCRDLYMNYPGDDSDAGVRYQYRNIRGGNWYVAATECRSANRCCLPPLSHGNMLGFRVMRACPRQGAHAE